MTNTKLAAILIVLLAAAPAFAQGDLLSEATDFVMFADFVIGSGWTFQLAISNNSPTTAVDGFMGVLVDTAHPQARSFEDAFNAGLIPLFSLPPGGTKVYTEWPNTGDIDEAIRGGIVVVQRTEFPAFENDTQMTSAVLTYRHDASGIEVTVPPLAVRDLIPPFFNDEVAYSIFVEETSTVTTGVALWKTQDSEICMGLAGLNGTFFQDPRGNNLACYAPEHGDRFTHSARMLPEWFPGWDFSGGFQGRLVVSVSDNTFGRVNDGLVIPMGLRANRTSGAISAVPVVSVAVERPFTKASSSPSGKMSWQEHLDQRLGQFGDTFLSAAP